MKKKRRLVIIIIIIMMMMKLLIKMTRKMDWDRSLLSLLRLLLLIIVKVVVLVVEVVEEEKCAYLFPIPFLATLQVKFPDTLVLVHVASR